MPEPVRYETRRRDDRVATNADQAEFEAMRRGSCSPEAGIYDDRIADSLDDYEVADPQGTQPWASDDLARENAASDIGLEVQRRAGILQGAYPFENDGSRLVHRPSRTLVYEFCLATALAPSLSEGDFTRLPAAFERLVRDALVCFLGPGARGFRTGWPPDRHENRPNRFKAVVEELRRMTGEWFWNPDPDMSGDPPDVKDAGLDFVVWKEIPDGRGGKLFLLGQCACGNDYETKFHDIDAEFVKLTKWIRPISWVRPVRIFSTPRHIANDTEFCQINKEAGFTLDRARITLLAEGDAARDYIMSEAREPYPDLIRLVIPDFQAAPPKPARRRRKAAVAPRSRSRGSGV